MIQTKALRGVEIKDASQGVIQAVFSTFDVVDRDGDVTRKSAFKDGAPVRISAYNHASWEGALPVGRGVIRVGQKEAVLEGQFFMNTTHGRDAFETVKAMGELQEFSYGFHVTDSEHAEVEGKSVRVIKGVDVHEVSPVLLGAGIGTRTLAVKNANSIQRLDVDALAKWGVFGEQKRSFSQDERDDAAESGHAMSDGSYPIENVEDLRNAIRAVGRGGKNHDEIRRHIMRQARRLDATNLIPDNWSKDGSLMDSDGKAAVIPAIKGAIPAHETDAVTRSWNGAATVKGLADDARPSELRTVYAWVDPDGDPEAKSSYRLPHHHGVNGPANLRACLQGIAALNGAGAALGIPEGDREAVYKHLAAHIADADREAPKLRDRSDDGHTKGLTLSEELINALASTAGVVDSASRVAALRAEKGKSLSRVNTEILGWIRDELKRLDSILSMPVVDEDPQPTDEEIASSFAAALARVHGL